MKIWDLKLPDSQPDITWFPTRYYLIPNQIIPDSQPDITWFPTKYYLISNQICVVGTVYIIVGERLSHILNSFLFSKKAWKLVTKSNFLTTIWVRNLDSVMEVRIVHHYYFLCTAIKYWKEIFETSGTRGHF